MYRSVVRIMTLSTCSGTRQMKHQGKPDNLKPAVSTNCIILQHGTYCNNRNSAVCPNTLLLYAAFFSHSFSFSHDLLPHRFRVSASKYCSHLNRSRFFHDVIAERRKLKFKSSGCALRISQWSSWDCGNWSQRSNV